MKKHFVILSILGGSMELVHADQALLQKQPICSLHRDLLGYPVVETLDDVYAIYPKTVQEIIDRSEEAQQEAKKIIAQIVACSADKQTKETMLRAYDRIYSYVLSYSLLLKSVKETYPEKVMRGEAEKQALILDAFWNEQVESNSALYQAFKMYVQGVAQKDALAPDDKRLLQQCMDMFERAGLGLSDADRAQVLELRKRCAQLESDYGRNIATDTSTLRVSLADLAGVDSDFIASLSQEGDLYLLAMNYPTQSMIMSYCAVESTRKAYYNVFCDRAYPANIAVLQELIAKRHEFSKLLGFASHAHYSIADQMAKNPERAWEFEHTLLPRALEKAKKEYAQFLADLPEGVTLNADGKLDAWNVPYVSIYFKKKYFSIDEREFAQYFSMEKTIVGLIAIYEKFFNLTIQEMPVKTMWHEDVRLLKLSNSIDGKVRGYVFLDMFPRPNKYSHAMHVAGIRSMKKDDGTIYPCVVSVVCNFTKPLAGKPSLLKYGEVTTFFHEFGHAIHSVLGTPRYICQSGTLVEKDFVELPSQMLENWMEDSAILKMISSHYQTGEPLSDQLIENRIRLLSFGTGMQTCNQLGQGMIALALFGPEETKHIGQIIKQYKELCTPYASYGLSNEHAVTCSFGHLAGYGARYYCYLWSEMRGLDVFEKIKEEGLLNPQAGKKYVDAILGNGGSKDANDMLKDFLGREPQPDAFYKKMGF